MRRINFQFKFHRVEFKFAPHSKLTWWGHLFDEFLAGLKFSVYARALVFFFELHVDLYLCMLLVGVQKKKENTKNMFACSIAHSRASMGKEQDTMAGWVAAVVCSAYRYTHAYTVSRPPYTYVYQAIIS